MVQYWLDRARINEGPTDVKVTPVSFLVTTEAYTDQLASIIAPEDEIAYNEPKNDWVFEIKPGDVFPVQIIASIQATLEASNFDAMMFPVVYRGSPVLEKRMYRKSGGENIQQASMPIFNLNPPPAPEA